MAITHYKLVSGSIHRINELAAAELSDGWEPFGSPERDIYDRDKFAQAWVKRAPDDTEVEVHEHAIEAHPDSDLPASASLQEAFEGLSARIKALEQAAI